MISANDSTLVHAKTAASLLIRMDLALARQWNPRMRQLDWWQEQSLPLLTDWNAAVPASEFARWIATDGELGALSTMLAQQGIRAVPPPDWNPPRRFR